MKLNTDEHIGLIGSTGSGKTYWFSHAILPSLSRVLIVDTENMEFENIQIAKSDPERLVKAIPKDKPFRWRWIPSPTEEKEDLDLLSRELIRRGHNMTLYIDELTDFSDAHSISPWFKALFRKARKRDIRLIWATQRPPGVNKWAFDNSIHKMFFYTSQFDRKRLDELMPGIGDQLGMINWKSYQYIYVGPDGIPKLMEAIK